MTESDTSSCPSCFSCSRTASTVTPPRECDVILARSLSAGHAREDGRSTKPFPKCVSVNGRARRPACVIDSREISCCFVAAHESHKWSSCRLALPRTSTGAPSLSRDERCSRWRTFRPRRFTCARALAGETVPDASSRVASPARRHRITTSDAWRLRPPSLRDGSPPRRLRLRTRSTPPSPPSMRPAPT